MKPRSVGVWVLAWVAFYVLQKAIPGLVGMWLAVMVIAFTFQWSQGIPFSWSQDILTAIVALAAGALIRYGLEQGGTTTDRLSVLLMAIMFGASQAYLLARWWTRRHNRPLP